MSVAAVRQPTRPIPWLFSPAVDLLTFAGSAVLALLLVVLGMQFGWVNSGTPEWTWVSAVLLIDVAHVYATGFRVYFDRVELRRRAWLYGLTPALGFAVGAAVYSESPVVFWRLLAYLAVFHFVRQQYGWVALYRARGDDRSRAGRWIDSAAIYLATLYPLVYWHAHLPRRFGWFENVDFVSLPAVTDVVLRPIYWTAMVLYFARSGYRGLRHGLWNPGKDLIVLTTAACWYIGIVALNSDYAFTVTNVIIHGIPYMVLVYRTSERTQASESRSGAGRLVWFLGLIWVLAYIEELAWDRGVWQERAWLFGRGWGTGGWRAWLVPLLAVPQITHYVLDGFIWRRRSNRDVARLTASAASAE